MKWNPPHSKIHYPWELIIITGFCLTASPGLQADIIGSDDFDAAGLYLSRIIDPEPSGGTFGDSTDVFGIVNRTVNGHFEDDTLNDGTSLGLVPSVKTDAFFAVEDLDNSSNPDGLGSIAWTFDITGYSDIQLSIDLAAKGDFEGSDTYSFSVFIDGGLPIQIFDITPDESGSYTYTFENGTTTETLDDPLMLDGTIIGNDFQTFTASVAGQGSQLTVLFEAGQNGDYELFALDNLVIEGAPIPTPLPASVLLLLSGVGTLGVVRRRRHSRPAGPVA